MVGISKFISQFGIHPLKLPQLCLQLSEVLVKESGLTPETLTSSMLPTIV